MENFAIRPATQNDCRLIYDLIIKMASYERLEHEVATSPEELYQSLFVDHQAMTVIATLDERPIGFALYFFNYSTFKGRHGLYIEDIFIELEYRGRGYGKQLMTHLAQVARENDCRRMEWIVLDWNAPSIAFYRRLGAVPMDEWTVFRLTEEAIDRLIDNSAPCNSEHCDIDKN